MTVCDVAPTTCGLVARVFPPGMRDIIKGRTFFSRLIGGTHIFAHSGPTNLRLRLHLALKVPKGRYEIRVGKKRTKGNTRRWQEGKVMVFDDSFEHEVEAQPDACAGKGCDERIVLIVDLWHPSLSVADRAAIAQTWSGGGTGKDLLFPDTPRLMKK